MERYFVRRALTTGAVAGVCAAAGLVDLHVEARYIFDRLVDQGLPLVVLSGLCGVGLLATLLRGGRRPLRPLAGGAVIAVIWGWGVAQFPYLLPTSLRIDQAAAPDPTMTVIFIVFAAAAVLVLPSLFLLYVLSQRDVLESEH
jgi:cytochrome d ubiquinol oxidase subunit II